MPDIPLLVIITVLLALLFDYTNGFHDTANAIATVVSTRVMSARAAVLMATAFNFLGAFLTTQVAITIANGLLVPEHASNLVIIAATFGAICWNLLTWYFAIPSSSSHALIGGLIGAALFHKGIEAIYWKQIILKVIAPMFLAPGVGFLIGFLAMVLIYLTCAKKQALHLKPIFRYLQISAGAFKALSHGQSDAQKTMGIITIALFTAGIQKGYTVPLWVILASASAVALGTAAGGWRIVQTMGTKIMHVEPVHGFAADTSAALVVFTTSLLGMPISTTQVVAASIFGVGTAKRASGVRWLVGQKLIVAWILTLPAAAIISGLTYVIIALFHH